MKKGRKESADDLLIVEPSPPIKKRNIIKRTSFESGKPAVNVSPESIEELTYSRIKQWKKQQAADSEKKEIQERESIDFVSSYEVLIFQRIGKETIKTQWTSLPDRMKQIFNEILELFPLRKSLKGENDGCYTFSYCDSEDNSVSVVLILSKNKASFFFET
ncbi:MAG TPA: hypothetical protein VNJ07_12495 [Chitinophagales bacterium]|nr:hypothetical protein [Chitinophagales bacterium]